MTTGVIRFERSGDIVHLTIDQPARRNAMTLAMWRSLASHCAGLAREPDARAVVLKGAGNAAFCAGADISEFGNLRLDDAAVAAYDVAVAEATDSLARLPMPTVALVQGVCFGGGFALAMACDLRLADDKARFRIPAGRLGLGYPFESLRKLVACFGPGPVADLFFTARIVNADEARLQGMVQSVWSTDDFAAQAASRIAAIADNAPLTLRAVKTALCELAKPGAEQNAAAVETAIAACFNSADYREGQQAFMEKRQPRFRGR
ncbi:MAG: enoyl-CoA hydratase [Hyphomicrobiaceae bacterium]